MKKQASRTQGVIVVLVTCPTRAAATRIAASLIERRLAACANIIPAVESVFRWQGKIERCRETLLVIKTTAARFTSLTQAVRALHPYQVPEIIALPVVAGYAPYLAWVALSSSSA